MFCNFVFVFCDCFLCFQWFLIPLTFGDGLKAWYNLDILIAQRKFKDQSPIFCLYWPRIKQSMTSLVEKKKKKQKTKGHTHRHLNLEGKN